MKVTNTPDFRGMSKNEICVECGRSVKFGSGLFVNRIPTDSLGRFQGEYLCTQCDETDKKRIEVENNDTSVCNNCQEEFDPGDGVIVSDGHEVLYEFCTLDCFSDFFSLGKPLSQHVD
jgi:NMD protein affecting ribosome stability and mRNA decay